MNEESGELKQLFGGDKIPEPNKFISKKLRDKDIEITGFSSDRNDLKFFSGEGLLNLFATNKVSQKLFSFLLENLMSRYLFNLMLRKSPNIESWPLNDEYLSENSLKRSTFGQSFIRLYRCYECGYLLKRIYAPELSVIPIDNILECPNCGLKKIDSSNRLRIYLSNDKKEFDKFY